MSATTGGTLENAIAAAEWGGGQLDVVLGIIVIGFVVFGLMAKTPRRAVGVDFSSRQPDGRGWVKCRMPFLYFSYKTMDGQPLAPLGTLYRRRSLDGTRWEYRQDEMTEQDIDSMQY